MIIKSSKENRQIVVVIFIFTVFVFVLFASLSNFDNIVLPVLISLYIIVLNIRFWISTDRTLVMHQKGCTVKFLCFSKTYQWSELKIKSVVNCKNAKGGVEPYNSCAIFSTKHRNPSWLLPSSYGFHAHPFSFIFVYFDSHIKYDRWVVRRNPDSYVVEENEFFKKMTEWNVEIKDERLGKTAHNTNNTGNTGDVTQGTVLCVDKLKSK